LESNCFERMGKTRRIKDRGRAWWFVGFGLYAVALAIVGAPRIANYLHERDGRKVDVRIGEFGLNVDKILETRTRLSFFEENAREDPVLLKKVFRGKEKVDYGGRKLDLDGVMSVSYSPDKKRGLILSQIMPSRYNVTKERMMYSASDIFVFNTSGELKFRSLTADSDAFKVKSLEEKFDVEFKWILGGHGRSSFEYKDVSWVDNDTAMFSIDCSRRTEGFPVSARVDIDKNNFAHNLGRYEAAD